MKKDKFALLTAAIAIFSLSACATDTQQVQSDLKKPIHCATAEGDIRALQSEKQHVESQIVNGVTAIAPAGIVVGVATGTEGDKLKIASGDYNRMIDQKIAAIKSLCGIK